MGGNSPSHSSNAKTTHLIVNQEECKYVQCLFGKINVPAADALVNMHYNRAYNSVCFYMPRIAEYPAWTKTEIED